MRASLGAVALLAALLTGCGGKTPPPEPPAIAEGSAALVSLSRVPLRAEPSAKGETVALLRRGAEVKVEASEGAFARVTTKDGRTGWIESGSWEMAGEKAARERRAEAVGRFASVPGKIVVPCPVYLAPDFGAARWGELEDGDPVEVVLADHDFLGVRLLGIDLAFVPAHAVRYVPPAFPTRPMPAPAPAPAAAPGPGGPIDVPAGGLSGETTPDASAEPYTSLPFGATPPVLRTRVEPSYPSTARKAGVGGDVVLQVVVERDGTIGSVFAVQEGPLGLTTAATDAVRRWVYEPARLDGQPIAVMKTVRVRFQAAAP
ncbi:MAG: TonB family protein [Thermoanaerobaculia bacterium]